MDDAASEIAKTPDQTRAKATNSQGFSDSRAGAGAAVGRGEGVMG